jgi:hypothetical protein
MLVRFAGTEATSASLAELEFVRETQAHLTANQIYEVQAVSVYKGISFVLLYQDDASTDFTPRSFFEMVDGEVPTDWICSLFPVGEVQLVLGPDVLAGSLEAYDAIVDHRRAPLEELWRRRHSRGPGQRFSHVRFVEASPTAASALASALSTRLTATFDARRRRESIPLLVEGLRQLGHDVWNLDEGQDDEERAPWCPAFQTELGHGLRVTFGDRIVHVTWNPTPAATDVR